jgi:hypothetical protein
LLRVGQRCFASSEELAERRHRFDLISCVDLSLAAASAAACQPASLALPPPAFLPFQQRL